MKLWPFTNWKERARKAEVIAFSRLCSLNEANAKLRVAYGFDRDAAFARMDRMQAALTEIAEQATEFEVARAARAALEGEG